MSKRTCLAEVQGIRDITRSTEGLTVTMLAWCHRSRNSRIRPIEELLAHRDCVLSLRPKEGTALSPATAKALRPLVYDHFYFSFGSFLTQTVCGEATLEGASTMNLSVTQGDVLRDSCARGKRNLLLHPQQCCTGNPSPNTLTSFQR